MAHVSLWEPFLNPLSPGLGRPKSCHDARGRAPHARLRGGVDGGAGKLSVVRTAYREFGLIKALECREACFYTHTHT